MNSISSPLLEVKTSLFPVLCSGQPSVLQPLRGPGLAGLPERVERDAQPEAAVWRKPDLHARRTQHGGHQPPQRALHVLGEGKAKLGLLPDWPGSLLAVNITDFPSLRSRGYSVR